MFLGKDANAALIKPPVFQMERSYIATSTALTGNGVVTNYNVTRLDNYSAFSSGVYTIPVAGLYFFHFFITDNASSIGDMFIQKNGVTIGFNLVTRHSGTWSTGTTSCTSHCSANDTIRVYLNYTSTRNNHCRYQFTGFQKRGSV